MTKAKKEYRYVITQTLVEDVSSMPRTMTRRDKRFVIKNGERVMNLMSLKIPSPTRTYSTVQIVVRVTRRWSYET